ncbi:unnamed protein product [Callosobruchus maculatus]|uniref:Uncharacterized protein n=1 Tax=Callosobruchus maculatus TaxID=64391 RepID=A0A653D0L1_CALMS|nr:unnamed protein product [Callosobruchus maculatus]
MFQRCIWVKTFNLPESSACNRQILWESFSAVHLVLVLSLTHLKKKLSFLAFSCLIDILLLLTHPKYSRPFVPFLRPDVDYQTFHHFSGALPIKKAYIVTNRVGTVFQSKKLSQVMINMTRK